MLFTYCILLLGQRCPPDCSPGFVPGASYAQQCPVQKPGRPRCCPPTRGDSHQEAVLGQLQCAQGIIYCIILYYSVLQIRIQNPVPFLPKFFSQPVQK
jgi:hypothetical protein